MTLYLDHAATSFPKDPRVARAMLEAVEQVGVAPGRGSTRRAARAGQILEAARERAARLLSVPDPERITFTLNATDALNLAIKGALSEGDEVVACRVDHNSVIRPLNGLERRARLVVRWVDSDATGRVHAAAVLAQVTARTRLVILSHSSNVCGVLQPVAEVGTFLKAHHPGACLLVDAAQTAGYRTMADVAAVADLIAVAGHKGPGGPLGTGWLWARKGVELIPLREGGTGTHSEQPLQPAEDPGRLEAGSANLPGIAGLAEALRITLDETGLQAIAESRARITRRCLEILPGLAHVQWFGPCDANAREPVFALRIEGLAVEEAALILEQGFAIEQRAGLHCAPGMHRALHSFPEGTLRFSFGAHSRPEEVDTLAGALQGLSIRRMNGSG